jgi:hypothetical protein
MIPTKSGKYIARPTQWTISESTNHCPQFVCGFAIIYWWNGSGWEDVTAQDLTITAYMTLFDKSGNPQEFNINGLKDSLGWDGLSLVTLNESDWSGVEVQLVIQEEEYQGKKNMKVKFINPRDYVGGGGVEKSDLVAVKNLDQVYGGKLRALNGGKAPSTKPTASANGEGQITEAEKERRLAYRHVMAKVPANAPKDQKDALWKGMVDEYFHKPQLQVMASEWREFVKNDCVRPVPVNPIGESEEFTEDEIPFDLARSR